MRLCGASQPVRLFNIHCSCWKLEQEEQDSGPCCIKCSRFLVVVIWITIGVCSRSQWPRGLRRRSTAARLLRSWVRIPPGAWMSVCCDGCVLSGRVLCDELITRPEESYRLWCVVVCGIETKKKKNPRDWGGGQGPLGGYRVKKNGVSAQSTYFSKYKYHCCIISFEWFSGVWSLYTI